MSIIKHNLQLEGLRTAQAQYATVCAQNAQNHSTPSEARAMRKTHARQPVPAPVPLLERFDNAEDQIAFMKMFLRNISALRAQAMK